MSEDIVSQLFLRDLQETEEPELEEIITFSQQDLNNLRLAGEQIKIIESTHRNLGLPTVFAKLADISNIALFLCGPRATGKTTVVRAIRKNLLHRDEYTVDFITPKGLKKIQMMFNKNSISVYNYDFASLSSEYLRDKAMGLFSSLVYDHRIRGETMGLSLDVDDCYCSFISTIQPALYRQISESQTFESQYKDRFLRYFMLYFRPQLEDQKQKLPSMIALPHLEKLVPKQFPEPPSEIVDVPLQVRELTEYKRLVQALQAQTSKNRGVEYASRLCMASAYFNNRKNITTSDAKFMALFLPFLNMELFLSERDEASEPLKFNANAYHIFDYISTHGEARPGELEKYFQLKKRKQYVERHKVSINPDPPIAIARNKPTRISRSSMRDDITVLRAKDMIKGKMFGKGGTPYYVVHNDWQQWYRLPVLRYWELIGS